MDKINFDVATLNEQQLAELIEYHNRRYWEEASPEISDDRYDELLRALKTLNPEHPLLEVVGAPVVAGSGKVIHARPMLSLDKAYFAGGSRRMGVEICPQRGRRTADPAEPEF